MDKIWDKKYSDPELKINLYIPNSKIIKILEEDYVLESGCGTGRLINCLANISLFENINGDDEKWAKF